MALIIVGLVLLAGYSLALAPLGIITGLVVGIGCLILWSERKTPSLFGGGGMEMGLAIMSIVCLWLIAALVRILHLPTFPWDACLRACAWVCKHILFR